MLCVENAINLPVEFGLLVGILAIADGLDKHVAQGDVLERAAEHIEDLAAKGGPGDVEFLEEPLKDRSLSGFFGN